jgi:hypothetical protein
VTESDAATPIRDVAERYIAVWNERRPMLEAVPSPSCGPKTAPTPTRWLRFKDRRPSRR